MNRRHFAAVAGASLLGRSWPTIAQPRPKLPRIGWLGFLSPEANEVRTVLASFWQGMLPFGYEEGRNVLAEYRWARGSIERNAELAAELVRLEVDLIVAGNIAAVHACRAATRTIPILCFNLGDAVAEKLATSLARPGGNVTGLSILAQELVPKQLSLLKVAVPNIKHIAGLWQPGMVTVAGADEMLQSAAQTAQASATAFTAHGMKGVADVDDVLARIRASDADALLVMPSPVSLFVREKIGAFIAGRRLPAMGWIREFVQVGALMSYGVDFNHQYRQGAAYVAKVLRGADPATLPIEQATKFQLTINLASARALGLSIPPLLQIQADEVIE